MKHDFVVPLGILATCALFLGSGCGNPCTTQREKVEAALTSAREARADLFAPEALGRAVDLSRRAGEECRLQFSRFLLFRSYRRAQELLDSALRQAEASLAQARTGEGLAKQEALNARYEAGMAVNQALVALRRAREMKESPLAQALLGRLDALRLALGELQRRVDARDYLSAREMGSKIREEAVRLEADANRGALSSPAR